MKNKIIVFVVVVGLLLLSVEAASTISINRSAKAELEIDENLNSTEIRGVYVIRSEDSSQALEDNLENDPKDLVVDSITSSREIAKVDWDREYELIIYTYGENTEASNDSSNLRVLIEGDYWGDQDDNLLVEDDNCIERYQLDENDDGVSFSGSTFIVDENDHIAVNFLANSGGFELDRDEQANIDNLLQQAYETEEETWRDIESWKGIVEFWYQPPPREVQTRDYTGLAFAVSALLVAFFVLVLLFRNKGGGK